MIGIILSASTWIAGKIGLSWALSLFGGGFMGVLAKTAGAVLDLAMVVGTWILKTLLAGLTHILTSMPAVIAVLVISWGSYGYGHWSAPVKFKTKIERASNVPASPVKKRDSSWMDKVLGN